MSIHWSNIGRKASGAGAQEGVFVDKIRVQRSARTRQVDAFVILGWLLILTKCVLASIAIRHWSIPIADFYVWGPSIMLGALCTGLYLTHHEE